MSETRKLAAILVSDAVGYSRLALLAGAGLVLGLGAPSVEAGSILDGDAAVQRDVATGRAANRPSAGAASSSGAADPVPTGFWFLPGFVQPYGYPLPAYADGVQTIHRGR
jgi:hypothetical protein